MQNNTYIYMYMRVCTTQTWIIIIIYDVDSVSHSIVMYCLGHIYRLCMVPIIDRIQLVYIKSF